jgi:glycogen phosphorylase/synthase
MKNEINKPDYLFEVSWEVCNKLGGIHTVISTKANTLTQLYKDNYICIGPDVWKETHVNPEFLEDKFIFRSWREQTAKDGIHIRIGRWQIPGEPLVMLVDFTPLFGEKDKIFTDFWLKFGLNSLSGQWDYTEPAMFGYAAGQLIESFYEYHMSSSDRLVAHFHEWMTGTGVLYLKDKVPQAGTVFTTHATTMGRVLAARSMPLYSKLGQMDLDATATELGIVSKHSLEQCAAKNADAFTTVSKVTANECRQLLGQLPGFITPNGFDHLFVPAQEQYAQKRLAARQQLISTAKGLLNQEIPENCLLVGHSGRYEFKNKGIDLFIDSLASLEKLNPGNTVLAYILVPANQNGVRPEVLKRIQHPDFSRPVSGEFTTHKLVEEESDLILNHLKNAGLSNKPGSKVKVVFVPVYLTGEDGALNMDYYDVLTGFDLTVFPSYYEPWGYSPLESIAFRTPAICTSLTGFAVWVREKSGESEKAVIVVDRDDHNAEKVVSRVAEIMLAFVNESGELSSGDQGYASYSHKNLIEGRQLAGEISELARWDRLISNYYEAIHHAVERVNSRRDLFKGKQSPVKVLKMPPAESMRPKWKKINVEINMPEGFKLLPVMAKNLWWCWNYEAAQMFERIDPALWEKCSKNPNILLEKLSTEHYEKIEQDPDFMAIYQKVSKKFQDYMEAGKSKSTGKIAYFSMEYGLHESVKIYSGGLGVLAGDYLKQASDDNVDIIAIGLLYRYGYFSQNLSVSGEQLATYTSHNFPNMSALPVRDEQGNWVKISIAFPGRILHARIWRIDVGRVPLYLLDADISENAPIDRFITHQLYGGDWENRFKQEFLLGIGGIRLLDALGIKPEVFHCNEGHAAFTGLERMREYVQHDKLSFQEALEVVRASSLFTTHTPVPAGHDFFSEDMLRTYMPHYAERLGISWEAFMNLGKMNPEDPEESYSMSVLASRLAQQVNGVSRIHGNVSKHMFRDMYPGYFPEELHIGYVTNGVHYGTWTAPEWQQVYEEKFGQDFVKDISDPSPWEKIFEVPDELIWRIRNERRKKLLAYIKKRLLSNLSRRQETPRKIYQFLEAIDDKTLTVGFARRFATYKRAHLLFNDLDRLSKIVNDPEMPVQFIYAGKAHPADQAGQDLIKHIVEISKRDEFRGKILFLEDYDMELGGALVQGVDVWLNTPTRPMEASGTSGEKAVLNGVLNFSVMDGWWAEGFIQEAGWQLKEERTYENQGFQNELDAETIYNTFETEIAPLFYQRNEKNIPVGWVRYIKNCIAKIAPRFTNKRMLDDYLRQYYHPLFVSSGKIKHDHYRLAREISHWKNHVIRSWDSIEVRSKRIMSNSGKSLRLGEPFLAEIELDLNEMKESDIGLEIVFVQKSFDGEREVVSVHELKKTKASRDRVTFSCEIPAKRIGVFNYAFRMFPKNEHLPHRQDFGLIKWL